LNKAYIIFLNDSAEYAVLDDKDKAEKVLKDLKEDYYKKKNRQNLQSLNNAFEIMDYEEYSRIYYWHIHKVPYK